MKKQVFLTGVIIALLSISAIAAVNANTNLAAGKSAYGTFSYAPYVTDGKIKGVMAVSGNIEDSPQYLTIDLGTNMYLDRIKIAWDKDALSNSFSVKTSANAKVWETEASNVDASFGALDRDSGTIAVTISLKRAILSSKYIQVMVPAGTKVANAKGSYVRIAEIEVYPSVNQAFRIDSVEPYMIGGNSAVIMYKTSIGAATGTMVYGTSQDKMNKVARNSESGVENSIPVTGLKPRTTYFYEIRTTDFYGRTINSSVKSFTTVGDDAALKQKVSGTFTYYPGDDKYVKPGSDAEILARVTDGHSSYFTSMATSGRISEADQYVVVDLGKKINMKSIVSYWRKLCYPESLTVQVSDNGSDWKTVADKVDAGKGGFAYSDDGDPMRVVSVKGDAGRYVKVLIKKGSPFFHKHSFWDFVQLFEVEVYPE